MQNSELIESVARAIARGCNLDPNAISPRASQNGHSIPEWMFFTDAAVRAIQEMARPVIVPDTDLYEIDHEGVERYRGTTTRVTRDRIGNVLEEGDLVYYFAGADCFMARINDFNGWGDRVWLNDSSFDMPSGQLVKIIPE